MRALVLYCHPDPASFTAAVRDVVLHRLRAAGAEVRLCDLYATGFSPALTAAELAGYTDSPANRAPVAAHAADLQWADTLIFVYPTWWLGLPALLKGWLDRVLLPGVAFELPVPPATRPRPGLTHIVRIGVYTTCGTSRLQTLLLGAVGKRTLLRGVRALCAARCRTAFAALYRIDTSTPDARARHLARVARSIDRLMR